MKYLRKLLSICSCLVLLTGILMQAQAEQMKLILLTIMLTFSFTVSASRATAQLRPANPAIEPVPDALRKVQNVELNKPTELSPEQTPKGPPVSELRCRGGGTIAFDHISTKRTSTGTYIMVMALVFNPGSRPAGTQAQGLDPGQCSWLDRGLRPEDPKEVWFETPQNAQLQQESDGSAVDRSPTAAERFPDSRSIPAYLKDPNHYWSFLVLYKTDQGYVPATSHQYWKPPALEVSDPLSKKPQIQDKLQLKLETPVKPDKPVELGVPSGNIEIQNSLETGSPNSIVLYIRWKKEYGLPADREDPFGNRLRDYCYVFPFSATVLEGEPGTFGREKDVGAITVAPGADMTEEDGYYVCRRRIEGLPLDKELTVHADVSQKDTPWNGGNQAQPPAGYQRAIIIVGGQPALPRVTLTQSAPRAVVNFEMMYAPIPAPPR